MTAAARVVMSDDGSTIWLTAYTEAGDAVLVALHPVRAVALAGELIEAAVPKLGNIVERNSVMSRVKRHGGDQHAQKRRQRDEEFRSVARDELAAGDCKTMRQSLFYNCRAMLVLVSVEGTRS
jgi:hypothetical protein